MTSCDNITLTKFTEVGIRPSKAMDIIQNLKGGKLSFTRKDGYNFLSKQRRESIRFGDVNTLFTLLDGLKLQDAGFVLKYTESFDGALASMFWCDSVSKAEFEAFGDVLVMDSTYNTNTYRFPLVILSGVNNHGGNCIFGAGILRNETIQIFKEAMNNKIPSAVITDQDASMCAAIKSEFPEAKHRLCIWHLEQNAKQRVHVGGFACKFIRLARKNCSVQEFEKRWAKLIRKYGVHENK